MTTVITLTHKIQLSPTCKQQVCFNKACGISRFTWNWALAEWTSQSKDGLKPSGMALKTQFNAIKAEEFPWDI